MQFNSIGLIGYGEVGKIFSAGLQSKPGVQAVGAWDVKFASAALGAQEQVHAAQAGVTAYTSARALCEATGASALVISAVTASNTLAVAEEAAQYLQPGSVFLDLNSASPGTKQRCAVLIEACGAHYVEAGVMTSVPPYCRVMKKLSGRGV